jgi:hypothetical protein
VAVDSVEGAVEEGVEEEEGDEDEPEFNLNIFLSSYENFKETVCSTL